MAYCINIRSILLSMIRFGIALLFATTKLMGCMPKTPFNKPDPNLIVNPVNDLDIQNTQEEEAKEKENLKEIYPTIKSIEISKKTGIMSEYTRIQIEKFETSNSGFIKQLEDIKDKLNSEFETQIIYNKYNKKSGYTTEKKLCTIHQIISYAKMNAIEPICFGKVMNNVNKSKLAMDKIRNKKKEKIDKIEEILEELFSTHGFSQLKLNIQKESYTIKNADLSNEKKIKNSKKLIRITDELNMIKNIFLECIASDVIDNEMKTYIQSIGFGKYVSTNMPYQNLIKSVQDIRVIYYLMVKLTPALDENALEILYKIEGDAPLNYKVIQYLKKNVKDFKKLVTFYNSNDSYKAIDLLSILCIISGKLNKKIIKGIVEELNKQPKSDSKMNFAALNKLICEKDMDAKEVTNILRLEHGIDIELHDNNTIKNIKNSDKISITEISNKIKLTIQNIKNETPSTKKLVSLLSLTAKCAHDKTISEIKKKTGRFFYPLILGCQKGTMSTEYITAEIRKNGLGGGKAMKDIGKQFKEIAGKDKNVMLAQELMEINERLSTEIDSDRFKKMPKILSISNSMLEKENKMFKISDLYSPDFNLVYKHYYSPVPIFDYRTRILRQLLKAGLEFEAQEEMRGRLMKFYKILYAKIMNNNNSLKVNERNLNIDQEILFKKTGNYIIKNKNALDTKVSFSNILSLQWYHSLVYTPSLKTFMENPKSKRLNWANDLENDDLANKFNAMHNPLFGTTKYPYMVIAALYKVLDKIEYQQQPQVAPSNNQ